LNPFVETGRFVVTAIGVAIAIATSIRVLALVRGESMSFDAFLAITIFSFFFASAGGLIFGLPAYLLARRFRLHHSIWKLAGFGTLIGATSGLILTPAIWQGDYDLVASSLLPSLALGAIAGGVAACIWFWLHLGDTNRSCDA
jgi:hypothetical protein